MAFFIVDLEFVSNLEITLLKRLKPDEILLISYIKSFPKGYYGSKSNLAKSLGFSERRVYGILNFFKEKKIIIKEKNKFFIDFDSARGAVESACGAEKTARGAYNNK